MQTSKLRKFLQGAALVATVAVAGAITPESAIAQNNTGGDAGMMQTQNDRDDDGMDWGWLGLLGLAGLLGLRRRDHHHTHSDTHTDASRRP